jgi:predicted 3-demethylubiquinone-9 3-methyltransferase (glyoxalase superfamily)
MQKITPFLWFDTQAEEAANFYASIFPDSKIGRIARYTEVGPGPAGTALTVDFELAGQRFTALNGGPQFRFTEAVSFVVSCDTQEEIDRYWTRLTEGGGAESQCGWLKDRFGLSWQIVPAILPKLMSDPQRAGAVMRQILQMKKIEIAKLQEAYDGAA